MTAVSTRRWRVRLWWAVLTSRSEVHSHSHSHSRKEQRNPQARMCTVLVRAGRGSGTYCTSNQGKCIYRASISVHPILTDHVQAEEGITHPWS